MLSGCGGECALECSGSSDGDAAADARSSTSDDPLRCPCVCESAACGGGDWKNAGPLAIDAHTSTVAMVAVMGGGPLAEEGNAGVEEEAEAEEESAAEPDLLGCECAACRLS